MNQMETDVAEVLSGSEGVEWNVAVAIAKATHGNMIESKNAAILLRRGWTLSEVLESLNGR